MVKYLKIKETVWYVHCSLFIPPHWRQFSVHLNLDAVNVNLKSPWRADVRGPVRDLWSSRTLKVSGILSASSSNINKIWTHSLPETVVKATQQAQNRKKIPEMNWKISLKHDNLFKIYFHMNLFVSAAICREYKCYGRVRCSEDWMMKKNVNIF